MSYLRKKVELCTFFCNLTYIPLIILLYNMLSGGRGHILWVLGALRGSTPPNLYLRENNAK